MEKKDDDKKKGEGNQSKPQQTEETGVDAQGNRIGHKVEPLQNNEIRLLNGITGYFICLYHCFSYCVINIITSFAVMQNQENYWL